MQEGVLVLEKYITEHFRCVCGGVTPVSLSQMHVREGERRKGEGEGGEE